jgi:hypothetical protein
LRGWPVSIRKPFRAPGLNARSVSPSLIHSAIAASGLSCPGKLAACDYADAAIAIGAALFWCARIVGTSRLRQGRAPLAIVIHVDMFRFRFCTRELTNHDPEKLAAVVSSTLRVTADPLDLGPQPAIQPIPAISIERCSGIRENSVAAICSQRNSHKFRYSPRIEIPFPESPV